MKELNSISQQMSAQQNRERSPSLLPGVTQRTESTLQLMHPLSDESISVHDAGNLVLDQKQWTDQEIIPGFPNPPENDEIARPILIKQGSKKVVVMTSPSSVYQNPSLPPIMSSKRHLIETNQKSVRKQPSEPNLIFRPRLKAGMKSPNKSPGRGSPSKVKKIEDQILELNESILQSQSNDLQKKKTSNRSKVQNPLHNMMERWQQQETKEKPVQTPMQNSRESPLMTSMPRNTRESPVRNNISSNTRESPVRNNISRNTRESPMTNKSRHQTNQSPARDQQIIEMRSVHSQRQVTTEEELLENIRTPELDSERLPILQRTETPQQQPPPPEQSQSPRKKYGTYQEQQEAAAAGFSFNRGSKGIPSGSSHPVEDIPKVDVSSPSEQAFTESNHKTNESLITEDQEQISSEPSNRQRQLWDAAINMELDDVKQTKAQERSKKFLKENILKTGDQSVVNHLMVSGTEDSHSFFAKTMFTITVAIHIYNFFTCFFFMGIEGQPEGVWFVFEIIFEVFMVFELCMQFLLRTQAPWLWKEMKLLHDSSIKENLTKFQQMKYIVNALPCTLIVFLALKNDGATLHGFWIACLRLTKLMRFFEVSKYFDHLELESRKHSAFSLNRLLFIVFYFQVFVHFWACIWLITGRVDWSNNEAGWYKMDNFNKNPSMLEMYYESYFFIITTFSGAGFGNVIPSTNLEWFVDTILNLVGSSLFICIFVDFTMEFSMRDLKKFHNNNLLDETMQFAESTSLPESLDFKIRYYYKDLNLKFQDFLLKKQIVEEMPHSIQGQVSIMLNREIIESVKFFTMATPEFISKISCLLYPQMCMNDDYIFKMDDQADQMYFVHSGYIEILCKNGVSPMVYFGKGAYFGEIGVLLTGKRSVSVRSKSNSVIYYIKKDDLLQLLNNFPTQKKFLIEVAKQRMSTTPYDNQIGQASESDLSVANKSNQSRNNKKVNEMNQLFERATTTVMARKPWFNQRLDSLKNYIILPFSPMWWLWNVTLIIAITMNSLLIPYGLGFEQNFATNPIIIFAFVILVIDIPIRLKTGVTQNHKITIIDRPIIKWYLDKWLILDVLATFPFEYILIFTDNMEAAKYVLLFRLLKVGRLVETCEIIRKNSRHSYSTACFFMELFCLFGHLMHWLACLYGWLGRREHVRNPRYDGNTFFRDFTSRPYITLGPLEDLSMWDQYTVCLYVAGSLIQAATYGDCIPSTMPEQFVCLCALIVTNTMRSFLFVRMAKFLGNLQQQQTLKIKKSNAIQNYMLACKLPKSFMKKIKEFTHLLRHEKSLWEGSEILQNLPSSLQNEIKAHLQKSQIKQITPTVISKKLSQFFKSKVQNNSQEEDPDNIEDALKPDLSKQYVRFLKMKHLKEVLILIVITWNIWFIPLQFSYKIKFEGVYLAFEIISMLVYLMDIGFCYHTTSWLRNLDCVDDELLRRKDRKIRQSSHFMKKEVEAQHRQIGITLVATFPMSLLMMSVEITQTWNMFVIVGLSSLRLIKLKPLIKLFNQKQKDQLTKWRIMSTVYIYYCFCHWSANIMIYMAIYEDDWTANWLRRCPVPQDFGSRQDPDYRDDLSPLSIYVHALYYCVSTVSHVAIADITAVNQGEFVANAIFGWVGFFVYCLLYADITLLVSNAGSPNYKNFMIKRNEVMQKLKSPSIPKSIVSQATLYLDYTYEVYEGVDQDEVVKELPEKLRMDFLLEKYKNITEQSILFRIPSTGDINPALASDLLKSWKSQIFLSETFIMKVGQVCTDAVFLLEGNLSVLTIKNGDVLGQFSPGDFYATDLDPIINKQFDNKFFKRSQKDAPPELELDPLDNFGSRSLVHLIARKFVTVGYISREQIELLYRRHPNLKSVMRRSNRYIFDVGRKAVELCLLESSKKIDRQASVMLLEDHYEKSSDVEYNAVIRSQRPQLKMIKLEEEDIPNISKNKKLYWIKQLTREHRDKFVTIFIKEKEKVVQEKAFIECCEEFIILEHSIFRKVIIYVMFFNRIYVALAVPFFIGYNVRVQGAALLTESISHLISFIGFLLEFRTPVVKESGELTLEFDLVVKNYIKNGMVLDVLAFQPFNLILPFIFNQSEDSSYHELAILVGLTPFRMIRLASVWRALALYDQIKIDFRGAQQWLTNFGNVFFIFLIGHWCVCSWVFLSYVVESRYAQNWFKYRELGQHPLWVQYIRSWYAIANIVSSVGSGDVFGVTDLERLFFIILMTAADIVFALAFGLLAEITSNQRANNPQQNFCTKLVQSERIMTQSKFNANWKDRVQQYMTYKHQLKTSSKNLNADDLKDSLPDCLIKEVLYHSNRSFLTQLFRGIISENLMRDLAFATKTRIFMPDDQILERNQKVEEICFIVEGTASKFNKKNRVLEQLVEGQFTGEFALLKDVRPKFTIRAQTFMLMKVISKAEIDSILAHYPEFYKEFINSNKSKRSRASTPKVDGDSPHGSLDPEVKRQTTVEETESSQSGNSDSNSSDNQSSEEDEEVAAIDLLPMTIKNNAINNARRQTWDSKRLLESRKLMFGQKSESSYQAVTSEVRNSKESMANLVLQQYQKQKTTKTRGSIHAKPKRRLSDVSIGSNIVINQGEGRNIGLNVDNS